MDSGDEDHMMMMAMSTAVILMMMTVTFGASSMRIMLVDNCGDKNDYSWWCDPV